MSPEFQMFLVKVGDLGGTSDKAPSLFSIGGRGYYENPTSDLLAFFMRPDGPHGLGDLFLAAFFECIPSVGPSTLSLHRTSVQREVPAGNGRIDLLVLGFDWALVIENKIRHEQVNPFSDYEDHAKQLRARCFYAVLSPDGECKQPGWIGISYRRYLAAMRDRITLRAEKPVPSKWVIFAEEFIRHVENELGLTPMTPEQIDLVETHAPQLAEAAQLASNYRMHVQRVLKEKLAATLPNHAITVADQGWAFRCSSSRWKENDMVLIYDAPTGGFSVRTYLDGNDLALIAASRAEFPKLNYTQDKEGRWHYWTSTTVRSSHAAVEMAAGLATTITALIVDKS